MSSNAAIVSDLAALRAGSQLLHRPQRMDADELVWRLGAVQAQDRRAFALALRARSEGLDAAAVQAACDSGGIVRTWGPRGTLHLLCWEDVAWVRELLAPRSAATSRRRLAQLGFDERGADRAVGLVRNALAGGPLTREEIALALADAGLPSGGQAPVHVLFLAWARGVLVHGPLRDGEETVILAADRLPDAPAPADPAAELAVRHLRTRAPARPEDFAAWSGLPLGAARAAWGALDLVEVGEHGWALRGHALEPVPSDLVRLLPAFDELLLGWKGREHAVAPEDARRVAPGGGWLHATVTVGGRVVGTWRRSGAQLFAPLADASQKALDAELAEIADWGAAGGPPGAL